MLKDDAEHPIPDAWRASFRGIVSSFVAGDYELQDHPIADVAAIDPATARHMAESVAAYGERLAQLDDATWAGSVYRWMDGYWEMLVDLTTEDEPVSDLALHAKLYEAGDGRLVIVSVHVP